MSAAASTDPPTAAVESGRRRSWAWLLPFAALALAVWLFAQSREAGGLIVTVRASEGHGIAAGHPVRYRGIDVGRVEAARLSTGLDEVVLDVRLAPFAAGLAREGTRFWIARPHVALESVAGLETLFGARYLAVVSGPVGSRPVRRFVALDEPPLGERIEPEGLELVLEAPSRFGLAPGAPLQHRGVDVGSVVAVDLAPDGARVEVRAYVRPEYAGLVRADTRFWEVGGAELTVGLTKGLRLDVSSLRGLIVGGIAFATPEDPGEAARDGARFTLEAEPEEGALDWRPALGVGRDLAGAGGAERPVVHALRIAWTEGFLFKRDEERRGWCVVLAGDLVGPTTLLAAPEDARDGSVTWFLGKGDVTQLEPPARRRGALAAVPLPENLELAGVPLLPRPLGAPEACLVLAGDSSDPIALDPSRLTVDGELWRVDEQLAVSPRWSGAAVVARADGALLGLLVVTEEAVTVAPLP